MEVPKAPYRSPEDRPYRTLEAGHAVRQAARSTPGPLSIPHHAVMSDPVPPDRIAMQWRRLCRRCAPPRCQHGAVTGRVWGKSGKGGDRPRPTWDLWGAIGLPPGLSGSVMPARPWRICVIGLPAPASGRFAPRPGADSPAAASLLRECINRSDRYHRYAICSTSDGTAGPWRIYGGAGCAGRPDDLGGCRPPRGMVGDSPGGVGGGGRRVRA